MTDCHYNDDYILVEKKTRTKKPKPIKIQLNREDVINRVKKIMEIYRPISVYLYGSTARGQNKESSDIDLFVIWKNKIPKDEIIDEIHKKLYKEFDRRIDFVNYAYNGKSIKVTSANSCFIQNVINDAVSIIEPKKNYNCQVIKEILFEYDCYYN